MPTTSSGPPTALLDANALYPAGLRDVLLRLADRGLYRPLWSTRIHEEWTRSVLRDRPDLTPEQLARTRGLMDRHFPDALVSGFEARIDGLSLPDPDDRHVLAAAIHGGADLIVTANLADFPPAALGRHGVTALDSDAFATALLKRDPGAVVAAARDHRAALVRAPRSVGEHLVAYRRMGLSRLATGLEEHADRL